MPRDVPWSNVDLLDVPIRWSKWDGNRFDPWDEWSWATDGVMAWNRSESKNRNRSRGRASDVHDLAGRVSNPALMEQVQKSIGFTDTDDMRPFLIREVRDLGELSLSPVALATDGLGRELYLDAARLRLLELLVGGEVLAVDVSRINTTVPGRVDYNGAAVLENEAETEREAVGLVMGRRQPIEDWREGEVLVS